MLALVRTQTSCSGPSCTEQNRGFMKQAPCSKGACALRHEELAERVLQNVVTSYNLGCED
jgi:hypothetical protein